MGGRYKIIGQLGAGGFGQTFLAEDLHLPGHPRCVIKRLQPQSTDAHNLQIARRLFESEAKVLYQLGDHDQIPRLLAHFEEADDFYLAQELIVGQPLNHELAAGKPWSEARVIALLKDILSVLSFVHQKGVIHRDIKPANLIRRHHDHKVVLIDFGAVKLARTQLVDPNSKPTQTISIGTHGYMPNEQIAGNPRFSSDIYAVGMIGIQALIGTTPKLLAEDPKTGEIQWRHLLPNLNPDLADVLEKMVRYDFRTRYSSAIEALESLSQISTIQIAIESPPTVPTQADIAPAPEPTPPTIVSTLPQASTVSWEPTLTPSALPPTLSRRVTVPLRHTRTQKLSRPPALPGLSQPRRSFSRSPGQSLSQASVLKPLPLSLTGLAVLAIAAFFVRPGIFLQSDAPPVTTIPIASSGISPLLQSSTEATQLIARADQQRQDKDFSGAIALYDQALTIDANQAKAHWGKCYSLNALAKFAEAIAACDMALKLQPDYPEAFWSKGYALEQQRQYENALALYNKATDLRPDFAEAWSNKGTTLYQLKRLPEAAEAFEQATRHNPNLAEAWNNRGAVLWNLRQFDEAIASVERAIQLQPDYQDALKLRQQMRQRLGQ
ncbi:tetratricopeptide repeat protein [Oscillatoria sp. FACHB-1407]|nr:tetratricopeptide repeat protein [Oscillatoria sp. FACHB-1407]